MEHQRRNMRSAVRLKSSPTTIQVQVPSARIFRCFSESNHWQELSQNKNEAPSPITTTSTWDRYLLQKCGASHVEPQTSSAWSPRRGPTLHFVQVDEDFLSLQKQQSAQQQQPRWWLHQLKVIGVFRNDTTNKETADNTTTPQHRRPKQRSFSQPHIAK